MSRLKIHYTLVNGNTIKECDTVGTIYQNKIHFKDENTVFDLEIMEDRLFLRRKTDEYRLCLECNLEKSKGTYFINDIGELSLIPVTKKLFMTENKIELEYQLEEEIFKFFLQYEVIK